MTAAFLYNRTMRVKVGSTRSRKEWLKVGLHREPVWATTYLLSPLKPLKRRMT